MTELTLSTLPKLWIIDLDGTIVKHNGHLTEHGDVPIASSVSFIQNIAADDCVLIVTARPESQKEEVESMLHANNIRYDRILFEMPVGERILINDIKPSGLITAHSINIERDAGIDVQLKIDPEL